MSSDSNSEADSDDEPEGSSRGDSEQTDTDLASMHPAVSSGDFGKVQL